MSLKYIEKFQGDRFQKNCVLSICLEFKRILKSTPSKKFKIQTANVVSVQISRHNLDSSSDTSSSLNKDF